jgi:hypothetical protein
MVINGKKVLRHMRILGLTQPRKVKGIGWTRLDVIKAEEPNTYWEADFSYVWTGAGNSYLCAVIDGWDRGRCLLGQMSGCRSGRSARKGGARTFWRESTGRT